jgi:PIN domain nuclease of toxin-antitoxin system
MPMNVLLDTCALIALGDGPLPAHASAAFGEAAFAFVSPVCAWEAAIKNKSGKLSMLHSPSYWYAKLCTNYRLVELPLPTDLLLAAASLPLIHRDPFDRVLVATAQRDRLTILTSDKTIPTYPGIKTLW